ncbi:MAG: hypothetical protein JXR03_14730 [Cyclobacteriaceae bacterium]
MKTGNKILFTFLATITIYILVVLIDLRVNGEERKSIEAKSNIIELSEVRYLQANDMERRVLLVLSDHNSIEVVAGVDDEFSEVAYTMKGDSLIIDGFSEPNNASYVALKIFVDNKVFNRLEAEKADFNIQMNKEKRSDLNLILTKSNVRFMGKKDNSFGNLSIKSENKSFVNSGGIKFDTLDIDLKNSRIQMFGSTKLLKGTLTNGSTAKVTGVSEYALKVDQSSRLD